jgi:hypothetical protein
MIIVFIIDIKQSFAYRPLSFLPRNTGELIKIRLQAVFYGCMRKDTVIVCNVVSWREKAGDLFFAVSLLHGVLLDQ